MQKMLPLVLAGPIVLLVGLMFLLPVLQILAISFTEPTAGLGNYVALFTGPLYLHIISTTVRICAWTTVLAVVLGYVVAYVMANVSDQARSWMTIFLLVPFWLSVLVRAFAWSFLLTKDGLVNATLISLGIIDQPLKLLYNETGVIIGMVHYMIPYAVLPMLTNMVGIERPLLTAARSLGAGPVRTFLRVWLPLSLPGVISSVVLVFIFSLGFFITPALLGGGKTVMVAQYIQFGITETMNWGIAAAFAAALLATVVLSLVLVSRTVRIRSLFGAA
jgi:putative spermidine/putrescine transport system permease protein